MFTAKLKERSLVGGVPKVIVTFSDGVTTVDETCIPQDMEGFRLWVKSRLQAMNTAPELEALPINEVIDLSPPITPAPVQTQAEINEISWRSRLAKMKWIQDNLIDTGVLTGTETPVVNLRNGLKTDFKASYIA